MLKDVKTAFGVAGDKLKVAGQSVKKAVNDGSWLGNLFVLVGVLALCASIVFGLWAWLWWGLVGGVVCVIEGAKMDPVGTIEIFWGLFRFMLATPIGIAAGGVASAVSMGIIAIGTAISEKMKK